MKSFAPWLLVVVGWTSSLSAQVDVSSKRVSETDGNFETGWTISIPSGSSDYLSVRHQGVTGVVAGMHVSVADFGASVNSFPRLGIYRPNLSLDPGGATPDLGNVITGGGPGTFSHGSPLYSSLFFPLASASAELRYALRDPVSSQ